MGEKTDERVGKYIQDYREKINDDLDVDLLRKVTEACGPIIFNSDAEIVAGTSESEVATVKKNFLIDKLGLKDDEKLDAAIEAVMEKYGKSNRYKYRAVVYYMLTKHFKKESVYK